MTMANDAKTSAARPHHAAAMPARRDGGDTLLIYAPVPLYLEGGEMLVEEQACNGLRLWAENFRRLIVFMPVSPTRPKGVWVPVARIGKALDRIEIVPVPMAYRPQEFLRALPATRRLIRSLIERADYLSFSIGGLFGDWGAVAAMEAHRMGRPFAVWTDRVESEVVRRTADQGPFKARLRARLYHRPMAWLERFIIRRSSLGLFHGKETYDTYAPYSGNPHIVHDVHYAKSDHIDGAALAAKIDACAQGPLRICYVGRADPMKGPLDWIETLEKLARQAPDFQATWLGEGDQFDALKSRIELSGLGDRVKTPGYVTDRTRVLDALREAHVFLFCHKTPESPRCLIEALISACPIVGYGSAFASDLVSAHGGGQFVATGDTSSLANLLGGLANDRARLADLIGRARMDGEPFDDVAVFRHRSEIIKQHLPPVRRAQTAMETGRVAIAG
jgi:glycosyltransferase involved in cell wall biosynthesis